MKLPGLITVKPEQTDIIYTLSDMLGESFLEEGWSEVWLSSLDGIGATKERKLEISREIIRNNLNVGAPFECVYTLPDFSAAIGGYLSSELQGQIWNDLEDKSMGLLMQNLLSEEEKVILTERAKEMESISNFKWMLDDANGEDFIHYFAVGVDVRRRGQGALRKVLTPFLDYASDKNIKCYLECYSDRNEAIYAHFGYKTVERFKDPTFDIVERCMIKYPGK